MNEKIIEFPDSKKGELKMEKEDMILSESDKIKRGICPCCDSSLIFQEGCKMCISCGWGGCS
jgi:hypothetical protein